MIMKKMPFILLLSISLFISCSSDDEAFFEEDKVETIEAAATTEKSFYIPPGAIVNNVPVIFNGCVTYTLNVQTVKYNNAVTLSPDTSFLNNPGNATVYIDIVPAPYGQIISTPITTSNQFIFVNSQYLSGRTSFYWRMRTVTSSSYNCWPNPTSWNFQNLN